MKLIFFGGGHGDDGVSVSNKLSKELDAIFVSFQNKCRKMKRLKSVSSSCFVGVYMQALAQAVSIVWRLVGWAYWGVCFPYIHLH